MITQAMTSNSVNDFINERDALDAVYNSLKKTSDSINSKHKNFCSPFMNTDEVKKITSELLCDVKNQEIHFNPPDISEIRHNSIEFDKSPLIASMSFIDFVIADYFHRLAVIFAILGGAALLGGLTSSVIPGAQLAAAPLLIIGGVCSAVALVFAFISSRLGRKH